MNLRNLAIWAVIAIVLVGVYGLVNQGVKPGGPTDVGYSSMLQRIDSGKVRKAILHPYSVETQEADGKNYRANTPFDQDELQKKLEGQNVEFDVKPGPPSVGSIILNLAPIILLFAAMFFIMRQ